ncbi:MAG: hypothetical protein LBM17_02640, partial [Candidatus Accumulibacter sp.]|nr:hypothetical protein [Accumulibacter sp.]
MASKRRIRRNVCGRKIRHATEAAARAAIRSLRRAGVLAALTPYRCPFCGQFHVGHPPRAVREIISSLKNEIRCTGGREFSGRARSARDCPASA